MRTAEYFDHINSIIEEDVDNTIEILLNNLDADCNSSDNEQDQ